MNIEINTKDKTITLLEDISLFELDELMDSDLITDLKEWKIIKSLKVEYYPTNPLPWIIPTPYNPTPYWYITGGDTLIVNSSKINSNDGYWGSVECSCNTTINTY